MTDFQGFPSRMEFTPVPNVFFGSLLPDIDDIAELKSTLFVIAALYRKKGYPRYVGFGELMSTPELVSSLKAGENSVEKMLRDALGRAVRRGTLLRLEGRAGDTIEDVFVLNDEAGRKLTAKVEAGEMELSGLRMPVPSSSPKEENPDIFTVYEQNIGILTPMIADELRDAAERYPDTWIVDAVKEAVLHNKRNIRYIARILETWSAEGRSDGTHQRHPQAADPDKYIKGKYGHMVRRR